MSSSDAETALPEGGRWPPWGDWVVLGGLALAAFCSLALPERLPAVDLSQHARMLALLVGYPEAGVMAEVGATPNPLAPYWLFHLLAAPLTLWLDPYAAARVTLALSVAAIPLAVGFWIRCRGGRPLLAVFTALVFYGGMTGWGFVGIVLGLPVMALMLGLAERLVDRGRWRDGVGAAALLVALYYCHLFMWAAGLGGLLCVLVLARPPWRKLLPLAAAVALTLGLAAAYRLTYEPTPYMEALLEQSSGLVDLSPGRLPQLFSDGATYGVVADRRPAVYGLWALLAIQLLAGLGASAGGRTLRQRLHDHRYTVAVVGLLVGYLTTSETSFLVCQRFPLLLGGFLPLAIPPSRRRWGALALAVATLCALLIVYEGWSSGVRFTEGTACLGEIAEEVDDPGRTLTLVARHAPTGYRLPVYDHSGIYLAARRGGRPFHEMFHSGVHALRPVRVEDLPPRRIMLMHAVPELYRPEMAADYDTILTVPRADPAALLDGEADRFDVRVCGEFLLARRRPSSREER